MQFDWWTLLLQTINFLILGWLLRRFLYQPVQAVIARRREAAEKALAEAAADKAAAEAEKTKLGEAQARLDADRQALLDKARGEAEARGKALIAEAQAQADALLAETRSKAAEARRTELAALKGELAGAAVAIARTILTRTTDRSLDAVFRDRILAELDGGPTKSGPAPRPAAGAVPRSVEVATAEPLAEAEAEAWRAALSQRWPADVAVRFAVDPSLVAGAELRLPQARIRFAWADQLRDARELLVAEDGGR